jgi:hypothetical protein
VAVSKNLIATLTVWRGDDTKQRRNRIIEAESDAISFNLNQGLTVLQPIILQHLRSRLPVQYSHNVTSNTPIKVKPTVECSQSRFVTLTEANFVSTMTEVWNNCLRRQRLSPEFVKVSIHVFVPENRIQTRSNTGNVNSGRRRATASRIAEAREEISQHLQDHPIDDDENIRIGAIAMNVWSRQRARQVTSDPIEQLPDSMAFRQATRLDFLREREAGNPAAQEWGQLQIRWHNSDPTTVTVHLPTLRALLGLPNFPLFDRGVFHEREANIPVNVEQDIDDIDHIDDMET